MRSDGSVTQIETIPVPIDLKDYNDIIAEIAELIYRAACDAEIKSAQRPLDKKNTLLPPPMATFFEKGENHAS